MRALAITPDQPNSAALVEFPEPPSDEGSVLVETLAIGVCGTDREIIASGHAKPPESNRRLVTGHESLGRVLEAPQDSGLGPGDLVVGIVRRPDPVPCINCAAGEWDMCRNGLYTECGIKQRHGFARVRFRIEPAFAVRVDPRLGQAAVLLEPASVLAKAWEQIEYIGRRARWEPRRLLVTGAGPVGLLAALLGVQRGLELHVLDIVETGPKPQLVRDLGGAYHTGSIDDVAQEADIIIECVGWAEAVAAEAHAQSGQYSQPYSRNESAVRVGLAALGPPYGILRPRSLPSSFVIRICFVILVSSFGLPLLWRFASKTTH